MEINLSSSTYSFYVAVHNCDRELKRSYAKSSATATYVYPGAELSSAIPVMTLRYPLTPAKVSGTILRGGKALANAVVTLSEATATLDNTPDANASVVAYSSTTDSDGSFEIPVVKSDRSYVLTIADNEGRHYTHAEIISPDGNDVLLKTIDIGQSTGIKNEITDTRFDISICGKTVTVNGVDAEIYNTSGMLCSRVADGVVIELQGGVYIVKAGDYIRKIIVK